MYGNCCFKGQTLQLYMNELAGVNDANVAVSENPSASDNLPVDGAEWVNLFVREMMSATSPEDLRARASRALELLEKSISAHAGAEASQAFQKVNILFHIHLFFAYKHDHSVFLSLHYYSFFSL